jgi:hypothetical protein
VYFLLAQCYSLYLLFRCARGHNSEPAFEDINDALQEEVDVLKTPEGAQEAIRSSLGYLSPGELRVPMLDMPRAAATLPDKWPYTVVVNILQVRSAQAIRNSGVEILNPLQP